MRKSAMVSIRLDTAELDALADYVLTLPYGISVAAYIRWLIREDARLRNASARGNNVG